MLNENLDSINGDYDEDVSSIGDCQEECERNKLCDNPFDGG